MNIITIHLFLIHLMYSMEIILEWDLIIANIF